VIGFLNATSADELTHVVDVFRRGLQRLVLGDMLARTEAIE
jgi:hypothetical protein